MANPKAKAETVREQIEQIEDCDSLAETPYSQLFHNARTGKAHARQNGRYGLYLRVSDNDIEFGKVQFVQSNAYLLTSSVSWTDTIYLQIFPLMSTEMAKQHLKDQLQAIYQKYSGRAERQKENEKRKQSYQHSPSELYGGKK